MPKRDVTLVIGESLAPRKHPKTHAEPFDQAQLLPQVDGDDLWGLAYRQLLSEHPSLVKNYEKILSGVLRSSTDAHATIQTQIETVLTLTRSQIIQKQWRLQWGNKSIKIRDQVERMVKIISSFRDAGTSAANADPVHAGLPWAGICFLLSPILNDSQQSEILLDGLDSITDLVARHRMVVGQYIRGKAVGGNEDLGLSEGYREVLVKLYTQVLHYQAKAACHLNHGALMRIARNIPKLDDWAAMQRKINQIDGECREYHLCVSNANQQSSLQLLMSSIDRQKEALADLLANEYRKERTTLSFIRIICDSLAEQDHEEVRNRLGSQYWDSGEWFFRTEQYQAWMKSNSAVLWLRGPVGVGKSCLTSIVIQKSLASTSHGKVAFFYCSQQRGEVIDVLRSLLAQMSYGTDGDLVEPTRKWFEIHTTFHANDATEASPSHPRRLNHRITSKECIELLTEIAQHYAQITWIIDGLDECRYSHQLVNFLGTMLRMSPNLRVFISSRLGLRIDPHLFRHTEIIQHFGSFSDIDAFVEGEINSPVRRARSGMTSEQGAQLHRLLVSLADGMFRWVELQLEIFLSEVSPILHPKDVEVKLDALRRDSRHASLSSVYYELFALNTQGQSHKRFLALKALQWVMCSFMPLSIDSLVQAVALSPDGIIDPFIDQRFILEIDNNFTVVTKSGAVKFAHRSVKDFLMTSVLPGGEGSEVALLLSHAQVAITCLAFVLSLEDSMRWGPLPVNFRDDAKGLELTSFEMYACFFWTAHCERAKSVQRPEKLDQMLTKLLSVTDIVTAKGETALIASVAFRRWVSLIWRALHSGYSLEGRWRQRLLDAISDPPNPLLAACIWGFDDYAGRLLEDNPELAKMRNHRGKSLLYVACENGHNDVVRCLLRCGVCMDQWHDYWGTSLQAAAWSGNTDLFQTMIANGASVNSNKGCYGRTLDAALRSGNPEIVVAALDQGAEVWLAPEREHWVLPAMKTTAFGIVTDVQMRSYLLIEDYKAEGEHTKNCELLIRLWKANLRRRELLDHCKMANGERPVGHIHGAVAFDEARVFRPPDFPSLPANSGQMSSSQLRCPYCSRDYTSSPSIITWRRHIVDDLRPYICPHSDCELREKMWSSRSEWATHIENQHNASASSSSRSFEHVGANLCLVCNEDSALHRMQNPIDYLAWHMERIALLVLRDSEGRFLSRNQAPPRVGSNNDSKRLRRRRRRQNDPFLSGRADTIQDDSSSSSGHDKQPIDGWSSDSSAGSGQV